MKNIRSSYPQYKKETNEKPVDLKTYLALSAKYMKFLMDKVFEGEEVTLPARMGTLRITGTEQRLSVGEDGKIRGLSPNWKKTKELWEASPEAKAKKQLVYNTNEHSAGVRYKFIWSKKRVFIENKTIYSLRMTRENKRRVFSEVMGGKEYL